MNKILILLSLILISPSKSIASAKVCIVDDTIEVYSNLIYYGDKALDVAFNCSQEIYNMFNKPKATIEIAGKKYSVVFKISFQLESENDVFAWVKYNKKIENNFIRIEDNANNQKFGRSNYILRSNYGFFSTADGLGSSTTCSHEYAHGLGLRHYNDVNYNNYGINKDLRGQGVPGIMASRGFFVDKIYQYDKEVEAGEPGGTVNPIYRIVRKEDVEILGIQNLTFDQDGCSYIGFNKKNAYNKDGTVNSGSKWFDGESQNLAHVISMDLESKKFYCK